MRPNRVMLWMVGVAAAALIPSACRTLNHDLDWGWRAERPADPLSVFSHQNHKEVFARHFGIAFASLIAASAVPLALLTMQHVMPVDTLVLQAMSALGRPPMM